MQVLTATLLGLTLSVKNVPTNYPEVAVLFKDKDESATVTDLMKRHLAQGPYSEMRAQLCEAVENGSKVPRLATEKEKEYIDRVFNTLLEQVLPVTELATPSAEELDNAKKQVTAILMSYLPDTLKEFDLMAWQHTPTERAVGNKRIGSQYVEAARATLEKIADENDADWTFDTLNAASRAVGFPGDFGPASTVNDIALFWKAKSEAALAML